MSRNRSWCAKAQFSGKSEFLFGTVFAEGEMEAELKLKLLWDDVCPHPVAFLAIVPGAIFFMGEEEEQEAA